MQRDVEHSDLIVNVIFSTKYLRATVHRGGFILVTAVAVIAELVHFGPSLPDSHINLKDH